jgi:hypothetical protein
MPLVSTTSAMTGWLSVDEVPSSRRAVTRPMDRSSTAGSGTTLPPAARSIEWLTPAARSQSPAQPTATAPPPVNAGALGDGGVARSFAAYLSTLSLLAVGLHLLAFAVSRSLSGPTPAYAPPVPPG